MPIKVNNNILRVRLRNGALANFEPKKIEDAIFNAAQSLGGFSVSYRPEINSFIYENKNDREIASFLSSMVIMTLNSDTKHHTPNFPPHIEEIQNSVIHVLRSYGFIEIADVYEVYRWGKNWIRQGFITKEQFAENGFPKKKMEEILLWNIRHNCETVAKVNELILNDKIKELVEESCAVYEEELDKAVKTFLNRRSQGDNIRILIVAGPSSSGKTTTTVKILHKLQKEGIDLVMLNLDNYFWPIHEHPTDWYADRDYETPEALDYNLINRHLRELLEGKEIEMPVYNFKTGLREKGKKTKITKDSILLLDCLHGLYPPLTEGIPASYKFKIYLETLNMQKIDNNSKDIIPFTDIRLLRRMTRDAAHRNHPPLLTILHWEKVRKSELNNIIPFNQSVDAIINGGFPFDLHALKRIIIDRKLYPTDEEIMRYSQHLDAQIRYERIKQTLNQVVEMKDISLETIPGDCVIREFIGGSTIKVPFND